MSYNVLLTFNKKTHILVRKKIENLFNSKIFYET
jgi:hypothetical protein